MSLCAISLNHHSAALAVREHLTYTAESRAAALSELKKFCDEAVILDTCNRSEVYVAAQHDTELMPTLLNFLARFHSLDIQTLKLHLHSFAQHAAVSHLFAVTSGIDSLMVGEAQVLAQVREAFEFAMQHHACGPLLSELFRRALAVGKRARTETLIGHGAISLSSVAMGRAQAIVGSLANRCILLIGAGQMSALAARYLHAAQVRQLWIANRTLARAQSLAAECGGTAISLENIDDTLKQCDVVFTATSAPEAILTYQRIAAIMTERQRPLCLVDLALPRNIDPCVATIPQITLIDLDGLQALAAQNLAQRRAEMDKVRVIIAYEVDTFWRWCLSRNVTPTISALRQHAEQIRQSELNDHGGRLRALSAHERKVIESMTASIIGRLLHEPTLRLKARASAGDGVQYAAMLRELFALDETENK